MQAEQKNDPYLELLFEEAALLMNRASEAGPDDADPAYVARAFHRLVEGAHRRLYPDRQIDFDAGAVAQTAATHFAKAHQYWFMSQMANLMGKCMQRALEDEGRKIEFPIFDYDAMSEPAEEKLESYGSGYDPLALHKFAQRIVTRGVLRVRGDDNEIFRAILELNEAQFVEASTREEFARSLAGLPVEIRSRRLAEFDAEIGAQPQQTPDLVAKLLRDARARMIREYATATFRGFMGLGDHGIRCGILATLFLAAQYANTINAEASGQPDDVVESLRPALTDLKKEVAAFFADWLTQPIATRPRTGKKAKADLGRLKDHYDANIEGWTDAFALCRTTLQLRGAARDSWRDDLQRKFPKLPANLIERLQPMPDWPEGISDICLRQGGEDKPEDIALEHAARLCGAEAYAYKLAYLQSVHRKQKSAEF